MGRDPGHWGESEQFKPELFNGIDVDCKGVNFKFIPIGAGRRICPITFGIANVELPLARLLYHFNWKLPNVVNLEELDMTDTFDRTMRRRDDLYLVPTLCNYLYVKKDD
ncbi:hypothetical protein GIB67_020000 [Kingdonia uniflora]|uniref:Cytochrome P450 n=1 Tax=Kingdonia uniflora TaxID=39325 RepID=A0A7J7MKZ4_9MAGN|nr:hypothetical protein GIB67_020000 [Kingdonia uniflora]